LTQKRDSEDSLNQSAAVRATRFFHITTTNRCPMCKSLITPPRWLAAGMLTFAASLATLGYSGCERKEKLVDIETPNTDVEVTRDIDTGEVEVNANRE
jgi:hypothetical protein